jgi:hypothetical protein
MGVHWKTKQTQKSLMGKSTLAHQCSQLSPAIQNIGVEIILDPPAFNYDNLVGAIWMEDPGHSGYDNREWGETIPIEVRDPSGTGALGEIQGGYYDNR